MGQIEARFMLNGPENGWALVVHGDRDDTAVSEALPLWPVPGPEARAAALARLGYRPLPGAAWAWRETPIGDAVYVSATLPVQLLGGDPA
ncbi:DUF6303 family protein [Streptomyces sp. NPDC001492]